MEETGQPHDEVLQQTGSTLNLEVGPGREMARLLKEDGVGSKDLAHVYRDVLIVSNRSTSVAADSRRRSPRPTFF
jgi:hypothetical protein